MRPRLVPALLLALALAGAVLADNSAPEALMEAGHWKRARGIVEALAKTNPNDARTFYLLSRVKLAFRDYDTAMQLAEEAVAQDDKNAYYHWQLGQVCGDMTDASGVGMFKKMGLAKRYRSENERAVALDPKLLDARAGLMEFYLEAPGILGGSKSNAQRVASEISQLDPARGFMAQAEIAQKNKDLAGAELFYGKAAAANPRYYDPRILLANYYLGDQQKKYDLAEKYALEAQKIDPSRTAPYEVLAWVYVLGSRWKELDALLTKVEQAGPDDLGPEFQAGKAILLHGSDMARAERYFRKYLTQEPEAGTPGLNAAHWRLGLVLEKQGRKQEAIAEIETSLQLEPNFEPAKKDLKRLK